MNKNIFISTRPDNYQNIYNPNDSNALNMELRHFFPDNNLLSRPQNMYQIPHNPIHFNQKKY